MAGATVEVVTTAQAFGFGPAAKLVSVTERLSDDVAIHFAGCNSALRYALLNDASFVGITEFHPGDLGRTCDLVRGFDGAISVMDPFLVFAAVRERRPVFFLDSLLGFWLLERPIADLVAQAEVIRLGSDESAERVVASLPVHESMIVAHILATRSFAQAFPRVGERIEALRHHGVDSVVATGPMTNLAQIERLRQGVHARPGRLLVNLGGFENPFLRRDQRGGYIDLMVRWIRRLAARTTEFTDITVCSGAFSQEMTHEQFGDVRVHIGMLSHIELLTQVVSCTAYASPPGLTSLLEAISLDVPLMLLPDQHYGHVHNRMNLSGTLMAEHAASFTALGLGRDVPADDLDGTLAIAAIAETICADEALFIRFADYMDQQLLAFTSMADRRAYVDELRRMLDGPPMDVVLAAIGRGLRSAASVSS